MLKCLLYSYQNEEFIVLQQNIRPQCTDNVRFNYKRSIQLNIRCTSSAMLQSYHVMIFAESAKDFQPKEGSLSI